MRQIIVFLLVALFATSAQAQWWKFGFGKKEEPTNETTINLTTATGQTVPVVLNGKEFTELTKNIEIESTRRTCFIQAFGGPMPTDSHAQVAREFRLATQDVNCGTSLADSEIAKQERILGQTKVRWGAAKSIANVAIGGAVVDSLGGKLIDGAVAVTSTAINRAGNQTQTTINNDNGSSIEGAIGQGNTNNEVVADNGATIQGNVGEGNIFEDNDEGIITNPADIEPIALGSGSEVDEPITESNPLTCPDLRPLLPSDPEGLDANGDGLVCSDGSGGATDN